MSDTEFAALAASIAAELGKLRGETWTAGPGWHNTQRRLHGPDQAVLYVSTSYQEPGRIAAHGGYPSTTTTVGREDITVAVSRGPAVIAREINRRLLPAYLARLAEVIKYNQTERADYEERGRVLGQVAGLLGGTYRQEPYEPGKSGNYSGSVSLYHLPGALFGSVSASGSPDTLDLDLHVVPRETALKILAVLAEVTKEVQR